MFTSKLGRWVGRAVAIAAFSVGATAGASLAVTASQASPNDGGVVSTANQSEAGASTDGYEWS